MAEAEVQMNGGAANGLSDENQPPMENHIKDAGAGDAPGEKKSSSSSSGHKNHSSSHKSSHGDKHRSSSSHKSSHGDKHRSSSSHKSSHGDKHRSSSSGHKSSSKDKDRSSSSSKHHSSSSSSKHGSSSSSSKHHSSSSKHGSSSSSKHGSSSSSSKHKSSSSDKHRSDHDKHHSSSSSKDKIKEEKVVKVEPTIKEEEEPSIKSETIGVKEEPISPMKDVKAEVNMDSDDDVPLSARKAAAKPEKRYIDDSEAEEEEYYEPKKRKSEEGNKRKQLDEDDDFSPDEPKKKKKKVVKKEIPTPTPPAKKPVKKAPAPTPSPMKGKKKAKGEEGEKEEKWKWWEEEPNKADGIKWHFLEHKGPVFAPPYEELPEDVRFYYDGEEMKLSEGTEEVAGFYARMLDHEYTTRTVFNTNFFKDWRKVMTQEEKMILTDIKKCNFKELDLYFKSLSEGRKNRTKDQKKQLKEENAAIMEEYGWCDMDGHKEKIGNFRIEPPGLFRGRGDHPKQGMLKTRTLPEDIIINCSKDSVIPQPPDGHRWKEVRHDNTVTWLASWNENIQGSTKYIMLAPTSKLKGAKDWQKYETARRLHKTVDKIRATYREDFKSKEMRVRQRAVALYFIDKLALRAGNEKDGDETADTVGCCSLRVEHLKVHEEMDGQEYIVEFDFLGKDSIRYYNKVPVEKRVFKNLQLFMENKNEGDDLFDRLNTTTLNKHLTTLMDGLTAKVFRTYNASRTLQEQLNIMTNPDDAITAKILSYNRANRAVALLCNHQRAAPKNFSKQMENLQVKIDAKRDAVKGAKREVKQAKSDLKAMKTAKAQAMLEKKKKAVTRLEEQLMKLEVAATDKDENKEIALGTSKLNYLDPRISVSWSKKWEVPLEKVYNKTQREKFAWAIDMTDEDYDFMQLEDQ